MATTVRDIIVEALSRTNIVSRRQSAPANIVEDAFRLLKGITAAYGNDNMLTFKMGEADVMPTGNITIGMNGDIHNTNITRINGLFYRFADQGNVSWTELKYVGLPDFYSDLYKDNIWACKPESDTDWTIYLRQNFVALKPIVKVMWNEGFDYDLNSTLHIPVQFVEMFTVALCVKLATTYPRIAEGQLASFKEELKKIEDNVHVPNRAIKFISADAGDGINYLDYNSIVSGSFLGL